MRLLHTADWHIGRTFHGFATADALRQVLLAMAATVARQGVDVVLVAGDVFDSVTPSAQAFELFEEAVLALRRAGAEVVMTSGNHDSPARLGHQAPFARAGGVHVLTRPADLATPVRFEDEHGAVDVYGIPYLEPLVVGGRTHGEVLGRAMNAVRSSAAGRNARTVVLAHCFAAAGIRPDAAGGERDLTQGGLDVVPAETFGGVDYAALGHLHSRIRLAESIRYPGAPLHLTFGETSSLRGAWLVDLDAEGLAGVTWTDLPVPRPLTTLRGPLAALLADPAHEAVREHWVQAVLTDPGRPHDAMARLRERFPHVARLEHRPATPPTGSAVGYGARTANRPDADLIAGFLEHVRAGAGPTAAETDLVTEVLARVAAAERAA